MRKARRVLAVMAMTGLLTALSPVVDAGAASPYCPPDPATCAAGSRVLQLTARYLGVEDDIVASYATPASLPAGVESCALGSTCDWWTALARGVRARLDCTDDLAPVCDQTAYLDDPTPLLSATQLDLVARWLLAAIGQEAPPADLRPLLDAVTAIGGADAAPLLAFVVAAVRTVDYVAPDVGPSARAAHVVLPVESGEGRPLANSAITPALDGLVDQAQSTCAGHVGWAVWLDYSKEGFSNDILLRASATVDEVALARSAARCPVLTASVSGSLVVRATSNGGSFLASKSKDSGLRSRSGSLSSTDRNQPRLVGVGPYFEWTTAATEIEMSWGWPPVPVIHLYRAPFGRYTMEATSFVSLSNGYRFANGSSSLGLRFTCTKQGSDPEACDVGPST